MISTRLEILSHIDSETLNSRLHLAGAITGILLFPFLLFYAWNSSNSAAVLACIIYGISFITTFSCSALFHSCRVYPRRRLLKTLDRISIYFLIVGSYTPLVTFYLQNELGTILLASLWVLALGGTLFELFLVKKYIIISVPFYVLMGCMFVFTANSFFAAMPGYIITLLLTGVALYLIGIVFYLRETRRLNHAIWHSFVLVAALCHYAAILLTVANFTG